MIVYERKNTSTEESIIIDFFLTKDSIIVFSFGENITVIIILVELRTFLKIFGVHIKLNFPSFDRDRINLISDMTL